MLAVPYHTLFEQHLADYNHPERPERLQAIMQRLHTGRLAPHLAFLDAEPAEREWLAYVHDPRYVDDILRLEIDRAVILDWGDTVATPATPQAALYAAGASVQAARLVLNGAYPAAFCPVRPPGHHAEYDRAMGFCVFNNIAVAAAWLLHDGGLDRVAIVDWDIHHGNGTERMFASDPRVLYISLHQYPHYPGSGAADMIGVGEGEGYTVNIPIGHRAGDAEVIEVFDHTIVPTLVGFEPQFILMSAGFDGHADDPLSSTRFSTELYGTITRKLAYAAAGHAQGRIVSILEGGYNLAALADSVEAHLSALLEPPR